MDIRTFLQTDKGRYVITGIMVLIAGIIIYLVFFSGKKHHNPIKNENAGIGVTVKDTTFKDRGDIYTDHRKEKKIEPDSDFFSISTDEMKEELSSVENGKKEIDYQKMADSILAANNQKVAYQQVNASPRKQRLTSSAVKINKRTKEEEIERFQKESQSHFDSYFEGANAKKNNNTSSKSKPVNSPSDVFIYAVISGDQVIKNKERVTLKLSRDALIDGKIFEKNTLFYAVASFTNNRVKLNITNINQVPVNLIAQDAQDGNEGIYIEGESLVAEVSNEAAEDQVRDVDIRGIPVGKTLKKIVRKKQRESNVQLLNNYKIILKTE